MSATPVNACPVARKSLGDSFVTGVMVMLLLNVLQRLVGLVRGLGFCHYLSDAQLGQWALLNSFLVIGVPIAVLGLPGSFGRFVEHFRSRHQLGEYWWRVSLVSLLGLGVFCSGILVFPERFTWLVLGQLPETNLVPWCVLTFISLSLFSYVTELVSALREVRVVSIMQFVQSTSFAVVGLASLSLYSTWSVLLPAFSAACVLASLPGILVMLVKYRAEFTPRRSMDWTAVVGRDSWGMWQRIVPFAVALWVMNLLTNLFEVSDRYMLLHLMTADDAVNDLGQALVGQYHCGRILPNLLTSLALMLGGVVLPYVSADWEAGQHAQLAARMRQMLLSVAIGFTLLSIGAMCVAPWLFHYGFGNRYQPAQNILPTSLLQAIWASLFSIAQCYLLCIERGKHLALLMSVGLGINVGLNWCLIQWHGLPGAVVATTLASLIILLLLFWQLGRYGCWLGWGTVVACLLPAAVAGGPVAACAALVAGVLVAGRSSWLLTATDREQIDRAILPKLRRLGISPKSLWP